MNIIMVIFVCEAFSLWSTFLSMNLRELVKTKLKEGLTQRELAARVGVSQGTINNILAGIYPQKVQVLERFAHFFDIDVSKILSAQYHQFPTVNEGFPTYQKTNSQPTALKKIPILTYEQVGKIQQREALPPSQSIQDYVEADLPGNTNFALRVSGNAMEPEFQEGDIIIVNPDIQPRPNEFVIATLSEHGSEKVLLRQLRKVGTTYFFHALNPICQDIPLKKKQQTVGKVVLKQKYY